jgi:alkyl sulfatase BDS1-like metallo-beta-lactamase superfamily hydrolase
LEKDLCLGVRLLWRSALLFLIRIDVTKFIIPGFGWAYPVIVLDWFNRKVVAAVDARFAYPTERRHSSLGEKLMITTMISACGKTVLFIVIAVMLTTITFTSTWAATEPKDATDVTKKANAQVLKKLPFTNKQDFEDAKRGFIAPLPNKGVIKNDKGQVVWDLTRFAFIKQDAPAPDTVNPSLWRQSQLVIQGGLYKVVDGLYQVRTAYLSNLTIIEGKDGLIVVDPLISAETAKAALDLYYQHRPKKPVVAVVHSHSHVDHYGGVRGVVSEKDVKAGKVKIYAPEGFLEAAVAENVLAGNAMSRRASYMYGNLLPPGPKGQVGAGLGVTTSTGTITLIPPTNIITKTGQRENIAGLDFEFLLAPDTEAPSEMHWYIEQLKALTAAENCCHTLHNTYSLRGAKIRDPLAWSKYLDQTMAMWGDKAEVMYGMHHWPVWGKDRVQEMLSKARDCYRYINDQTLRLANQGYTEVEIAEMIELPKELAQHWALRGYYGTMNHNVKATYVKYLGWFDGNPATLHVLPPEKASKKYMEFMGGGRGSPQKGQSSLCQRRVSLGGGSGKPPGFCRPQQQSRPGAPGRCAGAAGLSGRIGSVAQLLSHRGQGAAGRGQEAARPVYRQPRYRKGHEPGSVLRLSGRTLKRPQGCWQEDHPQPGFPGHQRKIRPGLAEWRPEPQTQYPG